MRRSFKRRDRTRSIIWSLLRNALPIRLSLDPKEDVGIDQDQVVESVPKQVLVKVEVHTGLA